jgi:hypothetical protein
VGRTVEDKKRLAKYRLYIFVETKVAALKTALVFIGLDLPAEELSC